MKKICIAALAALVLSLCSVGTHAQTNATYKPTSCDDVKTRVEPVRAAKPDKKHELTLTDAEVAVCFPGTARRIVQLQNTVNNQKKSADRYRDESWWWLQTTQLAVMLIGAAATIFLALVPPEWKTYGVVFTAAVTAITAVDAFYDFRGSAVRHMKVQSDMGALESQIEDMLLFQISTASGPVLEKGMETKINDWSKQRDAILKAASDQYQASFTKKE